MTHRYAVLIGAASRGGYYRSDRRRKDRRGWECPDLIRYSDLGDALIDWVSLTPADATVRGIYDDGVDLAEDESPFRYAHVEIGPRGIEAGGWMAECLYGSTYGYTDECKITSEEIAAKLLAYRARVRTNQ
jgi:hypothetical protein